MRRDSSTFLVGSRGRLEVIVIEAKNLYPKESVIVMSDDPICKVTVGKKTYKSSCKINTLSPKWNEKFCFTDVQETEVMQVVIRDNQKIGLGHFYGEVLVPISSIKKNQEQTDWFPLCKRPSTTNQVGGSLLLKVLYQPSLTREDPMSSDEHSCTAAEDISTDVDTEEEEGTKRKLNIKEEHVEVSDDDRPVLSQFRHSEPQLTIKSDSLGSLDDSSPILGRIHREPSWISASAETDSPSITKKVDLTARFHLPSTEVLIKDFSGSMRKNIWIHGRIYIYTNYICFYSNLFGKKTVEVIPVSEITNVSKSIRNLSLRIRIHTNTKEVHFVSLFKEKIYESLTHIWQSPNVATTELKVEDVLSDSDEEENWEESFLTQCETEDNGFLHSGTPTLLVNEEFPVSVLQFFKMFFSNKSFALLYHENRSDKDIKVNDWAPGENGTYRDMSYTAPLKAPIGPSTAPCVEKQRYLLTRTKLLVEDILITNDIPYGDYFQVESKWSVTPGSTENSCKLTVHFGVYFSKKTWWEGKIMSGALKESEKSYELFCQLARKEISKRSAQSAKANTIKDSVSTVSVSESVEMKREVEEVKNKLTTIDLVIGAVLVLAWLAMTVLWWTEMAEVDLKANILVLLLCFLGYRVYKLEKEVVKLRELVNKQ